MYKAKKLARGYNQTELFSKNLAEKLKLNYEPLLIEKVVENKRQSSLTFKQRQENVRGVFEVRQKDVIRNKNIILVDDIYTSRCNLGRMR